MVQSTNSTSTADIDVVGADASVEGEEEEETKGSGWFSSSLIVTNAALGAGVLAFPQAFNKAGGIIPALVVLVIMMFFAGGSIMLLGMCADRAMTARRRRKTAAVENDAMADSLLDDEVEVDAVTTTEVEEEEQLSYQSALGAICGPKWELGCAMFISVYTYGTAVTFLIIVGDQTDALFASHLGTSTFCASWYLQRRVVVPILTLIFVVPLCFFKNIDTLKYASAAATASVLYLMALVVAAFLNRPDPPPPVKTSPQHWTDVLAVIPAICFGYQCHVSIIPVYSCVRPRQLKYLGYTMISSFTLISIVYVIFGVFGYLAFGIYVDDDILSSLPTKNNWFAFGYVIFAIKMFLTYPILLFCGRLAIGTITSSCGFPLRSPHIVTVVWLSSSIVLSVMLPSISVVVDALGFLSTNFIFVFPGYCALRIWREDESRRSMLVISFVYLTLGMFVAGVTFTQTVQSLMDDDAKHAPHYCR